MRQKADKVKKECSKGLPWDILSLLNDHSLKGKDSTFSRPDTISLILY